MAHIVAQSETGPRGRHLLPLSERDRYENLILVCPNDHERIDADEAEWSVDRLQAEKLRHERWVQELLDKGAAIPVEIDSSQFREQRAVQWATELGSWMYIALTPLKITDDAIDPLTDELRLQLFEGRLPPYLKGLFGVHPNPYNVEPSAHGLVAEDFSQLGKGMGYRIEIFRVGHAEYAVCLSAMLDRISLAELNARPLTRAEGVSDSRKVGCGRLLEYRLWAETLIAQIRVLRAVWQELPFNDMIVTTTLSGVEGMCLLMAGGPYHPRVGRAAEGRTLSYEVVMPRKSTAEELATVILRRFVNFLGLDLPRVFDEEGRLLQPTTLAQPRRT